MTKEEAKQFFAEFYRGEHHIPNEPKEFGLGFCVIHDRGDFATFDFSELTKLVLMAHEQCVRVSVDGHSKNKMRISIWKREREGGISKRHPTIEQAIESFNNQIR